ncbi:MAG: hypothetical protein FJ033_14865 [Chloroflexi bacterium]|nr:hypothetical protein [Chloroflexota bacterium]
MDKRIAAYLADASLPPLDSAIDDCLVGTPASVAARVRQYVDLGISHFMLWFLDVPSLDGARLFADTIAKEYRT